MTAHKPLRILVVISHPWDLRLGAPRVYMELAEQWRASGNVVEKFSLSDAYPNGAGSGAKFLIRQFLFARKAAAFIRRNRDRYDVVDALVGDLPFSKAQLGFRGLLVARSVGLPQLYDEFEQTVPRRWPGRSRGRLRGRIFYEWARRRRVRASQAALAHADVINVPNAAESMHLRSQHHGAMDLQMRREIREHLLTGVFDERTILAPQFAQMKPASQMTDRQDDHSDHPHRRQPGDGATHALSKS